MQLNPLAIFIFAAAIGLTWVAWSTYTRRDHDPMPVAGSALLLSFAVWSVGYGMMLIASGYEVHRFWNTIRFAGMVLVPPLWFTYVFEQTKRENYLTPLVSVLLWVVAPIAYLLVATNDAHHLMWIPLAPEATQGLFFFKKYQIGFQVFAIHSYIVGLISTVLLAGTVLRSRRLFRKQGMILVLGLLSIAGTGLIQLTGLSAFPALDFSWLMAAIFGPVIALGYNRLRREDIRPVVYEHVVQSMQEVLLVVDQHHRIVSMNRAAEELFNMQLKDVSNQPAESVCENYQSMQADAVAEPDGSMRLAINKDERTFDVTISPMRDMYSEIVSRVIVMCDITQRVAAEREVERALVEKEVMLKEIHHRVKNNLQIIISLLNLQVNQANDSQDVAPLLDSQRRVKAMALVHETLYQAVDLAHVDFKQYLSRLINDLTASFSQPDVNIQLEMTAEALQFGLDEAIPCGLIISELVSNAIEHAFTPGTPGEVRVKLDRIGQHITLCVADNGSGFPSDYDFASTQTLGFQLVRLLVGQLNGELELDTSSGAALTITFDLADTVPATTV